MSSRPPSSFSPPRLTELALDRPNHTLVQHSSVPFSNLKVTLEYKRRHEGGGEVDVLSKEHRVSFSAAQARQRHSLTRSFFTQEVTEIFTLQSVTFDIPVVVGPSVYSTT